MGYLFHNLSNIWNTFQQGCQNWPVLLFVFKYWVKGHATCTVPTGPNLTPKRTPKRTQGSLWVSFESAFQKASALGPLRVCSESAQGPLGVRSASALGGPICALMREADSALLLPPTSPPLVYSKYTVQPVYYVVAIGSIHTCRSVKRFHGEHQQNHLNFALYSTKNVTLSENKGHNRTINMYKYFKINHDIEELSQLTLI